MVKAEPTQSMEEILKTLNDTIAQQQAQINQLLESQKGKPDPAVVTPPVVPSPAVEVAVEAASVKVTEVVEKKRKQTDWDAIKASKIKRKDAKVAAKDAKAANQITPQVKGQSQAKGGNLIIPQAQWDKIMIKVVEEKEEGKEWWIDEATAEKVRLLREDALFKAKVIFAGISLYKKSPIPPVTITCSKVKADETESFYSMDMVGPEMRGFDKLARENPQEALNDFKGDSLLVDRYAEMVTLVGVNRSEFICCSSKKGFISFYALTQSGPGSSSTRLEHHITLELKHLLKSMSGARLRLLRGMLEEATDPTVKGINLFDNFNWENRGGAVTCRVVHDNKKDNINTTDSTEKRWTLCFSDMVVMMHNKSRSIFSRDSFNDSVDVYKKALEGSEEVTEVVQGEVEQVVSDVAMVDADEVVAVETVDEMNNSFVPLSV